MNFLLYNSFNILFHVSMKIGDGLEDQKLAFYSKSFGGIINSAAVLDDKLFKDVDRESYRRVFGPKITGNIDRFDKD